MSDPLFESLPPYPCLFCQGPPGEIDVRTVAPTCPAILLCRVCFAEFAAGVAKDLGREHLLPPEKEETESADH